MSKTEAIMDAANDRPFVRRFLRHVRSNGSCHLWQGAVSRWGYGVLNIRRGFTTHAHRFAWTLANGPIPEGMSVCHHCDVRLCVNPDHLFLGTAKENALDRGVKGRCRTGHRAGELSPHAKMTYATVLEIRALLASGLRQKDVAARLGLHKSRVQSVASGASWKYGNAVVVHKH